MLSCKIQKNRPYFIASSSQNGFCSGRLHLHLLALTFYYLIGAQARDLWYAGEKASGRFTADVDFAVLITNPEQFERVKEVLEKEHGFSVSKANAFALHGPDGTTVDILPFGGMEEDDRIIAGGQGLTSIDVSGFKEVGAAGTALAIFKEDTTQFRLATLPAIVLLKLIAYNDRPEIRTKDPEDIIEILNRFFLLKTELFYDVHHDLLSRLDEGEALIAARAVGREMHTILVQSAALQNRVQGIVATELRKGANSRFLQIMALRSSRSIEELSFIVIELQKGLEEGVGNE